MKWNDCAEYIILDKFWCPAGIKPGVFIDVPHIGTQFISQSNFLDTFDIGGFFAYGSKEDNGSSHVHESG